MSNIFQILLNLTPTISIMILVAMILRLIFLNVPKRINKILWIIIGIRCCIPFSFSSVVGLLPNKTVPYVLSNQGIQGISTVRPDTAILKGNEAVIAAGSRFRIEDVFPYIWMIGLVAFLIYMVCSYIKVKQLVSDAIPYKENIYESDKILSPFVMGMFRPRIYIKSGTQKEEKAFIIAHEKCHIKNKDNILKIISFIILGVYWFNPLIWIAYILFCKDIELACDEEVIKPFTLDDRKNYAIALLESSHKNNTFFYRTAFSENYTKERIKSVMNYKKPKFWVVGIAVIACVAFLVVFFTVNKDGSVSAKTDYITYEFETFDGENVVINADNIITQEKSDDPENSELISESAAGNIIAPGRDYVYLSDDNYYYVADYYNKLITVASKSVAEDAAEEILDDNPGFFETEDISLTYDTEKFFGYQDGDAIILNSLTASAGTSLIQINKTDCHTLEDALNSLSQGGEYELSKAEAYDFNGYKAIRTNHIIPDSEAEGVVIDDYYIIAEHNGKVFLIDKMITRDSDSGRANALEKEFSDALNQITLK